MHRECLDWVVLIVDTPQFAKADWKFIVVSIVITLAMVVVAVVLTTMQISIPLRRIEASMKAIINLDFETSPRPSVVTEISGIVTTFGHLRGG